MIIKTMQDAKATIDNIDNFCIKNEIKHPTRPRFNLGASVDVYRNKNNLWTGSQKNDIKFCASYDEIIDFVFRHRHEINQYTKRLIDEAMNEDIIEMIRDYDRRLQLAYEKTGDKRAKALLDATYKDEDDICDLLAELEGWDDEII